MAFAETPRQAVVAGRFYPGDPVALRAIVSDCLRARPRKVVDIQGKTVLGMLLPHAGYVFSGKIAGMTLAKCPLPRRILVLGPNHTGGGDPLAVWHGGAWQTPLGEMQVDRETSQALIDSGAGYTGDTQAHLQEHSIEVLVPFFQVLRPDVVLTSITVGAGTQGVLARAGEQLARVLTAAEEAGDPIMLVVSSDMSHYLPHEMAVARDTLALAAMKDLDPSRYYTAIQEHSISMCGLFPMTLALTALRLCGAATMKVIGYATSGQTGRMVGADMGRVVGYAGAMFLR